MPHCPQKANANIYELGEDILGPQHSRIKSSAHHVQVLREASPQEGESTRRLVEFDWTIDRNKQWAFFRVLGHSRECGECVFIRKAIYIREINSKNRTIATVGNSLILAAGINTLLIFKILHLTSRFFFAETGVYIYLKIRKFCVSFKWWNKNNRKNTDFYD